MSHAELRDALRAAYGASPLTQAQIAARAGVSENTVGRALAGKPVRSPNLIALAAALGLRLFLRAA